MSKQVTIAAETALVIIDMEKGFLTEDSALCVKGALATVPACKKVLDVSRKHDIPIFYVKRLYRSDGSDVEATKWWNRNKNGCPIAPGSTGPVSGEYPDEIKPQPGDFLINKPRWSAFYKTDLDLIFRRLGVRNVVLIGTTTPNCIRATAFEAMMLDYETLIISDATSSVTEEIQRVNLEDMQRAGAILMTADEYEEALPDLPVSGWVEQIREQWISQRVDPQPVENPDGSAGWTDRW
jgi:nicotinamidase-related amidase